MRERLIGTMRVLKNRTNVFLIFNYGGVAFLSNTLYRRFSNHKCNSRSPVFRKITIYLTFSSQFSLTYRHSRGSSPTPKLTLQELRDFVQQVNSLTCVIKEARLVSVSLLKKRMITRVFEYNDVIC